MDKKSIFSIFGLDDFNLSDKLSNVNIKDYVKNQPKIREMFDKLSDEDKNEVVKSLNALTETFDDMFSTKSEKWTVDDLTGCNVTRETVDDGKIKSTTIVIEKNNEESMKNKKENTQKSEETKIQNKDNKKSENKKNDNKDKCTCGEDCGKNSCKNDKCTCNENNNKKPSLREMLANDIKKAEEKNDENVAKSVANTIIEKLQSKDYTVDVSKSNSAIVVEFNNKYFNIDSNKQRFIIKDTLERVIGDTTITFVNNDTTYKVYIVL